VVRLIGSPFVGAMLSKIAALGIAKCAENARIGECGTANGVINVPMASLCPVNAAGKMKRKKVMMISETG